MGIFSAAIALFGPAGMGQQKRPLGRPSNDEIETQSTILVIDEDPILVQAVKSMLIKRGFNVLTSSSGARGLGILNNAVGDIRVVLLNCSTPKLNYDETLKFVRQARPNAKVIGLTGMDLDSVPREYLDGIDKVLTKPVIADQLIGAVDELLGNGRTGLARIEPGMLRHPTAKPQT